MTRRLSLSLSPSFCLFVNVHAFINARSPALAAIEHSSTPLATHSRQRSGSSFRGSRDRPFILVHAPRPSTTSRSRSRARRSRVDPAAFNVVVLATRAAHTPRASRPRQSAIAGEDLLSSDSTEHHLRRSLSASSPDDREPPPSPQSPNVRPPRHFSVLLSLPLPLSANEIPFVANVIVRHEYSAVR